MQDKNICCRAVQKLPRRRNSAPAAEYLRDSCWRMINYSFEATGRSFICGRISVTLNVLDARGEVSEWLKEHAWKACVGATQPWVRIPPSPPLFSCGVCPLGRRAHTAEGLFGIDARPAAG
jgi:hypothetical protein